MKFSGLVLAFSLLVGVFFVVPLQAQTLFNISSDTTEVIEEESTLQKQEDKQFTIDQSLQQNGSPLALKSSGGNFHLPSKDPHKRNPLAPPPLSSDEISPEENATYQALVNYLQTCVFIPPGASFPGLNQSNLNFQSIPQLIETVDTETTDSKPEAETNSRQQ